jgi:predicted ArsR family transcriptional regulator
VYAPSGREFSVSVPARQYDLAARLLAAAVDSDSSGTSQSMLLDAARDFGTDVGSRASSRGRAKPGPLSGVAAVLNEYGFEPYTAGDGVLELRNCPFHQLAAAHRDLVCNMNLALMQGVVAGIKEPAMRARLDPKAGRCCVVIGPARRPGNPNGDRS